ncbi:uncharacterized protein SPPG_07114 [Spizellomyces punctatus DAOM BR117]|uniref:Arrestin C-terminal-like domain-containing protein n=1 Tax=Spizellomyces punctatus (strain DAOM BR117) TaxID=645134 RepID=A0A0L0H9G0_SPIPD|nr:uncharacterized protein SPPG_07114 [Spizellomyces punctatus DAOM BR117]KNC97646.1 hypothetical protein SPPG_07114 [Spizellomyces punctatus DAOM BR117]|eukprot:XP_016605686.1 hypothetical protein SPPG_07114 [Spizellomyces punctatus DAOM BR117]
MKEPAITLIPLEGQESFVEGHYGIEATTLRGTIRISQPNRTPLSLYSATIAFHASVSSWEEHDLLELHSSILPEDHDGKLEQGTHILEWSLDLPSEPLLPPSRKVVSSSMGYNRTMYRVKYRLVATLCWHGIMGRARKEAMVPIEPFTVYPDPDRDEQLVKSILSPAGFRWEDITSLVQYDVAVSSTVLGPGDSFDFAFRVVPRGHVCENIKFKLIEICDVAKIPSSNASQLSTGATKRKLISWDWKSSCWNALEDFFDNQWHRMTVPSQPRPNPSTIESEYAQGGLHGTVRHQIRIVIEFDDAPSIKLECPVTILSVPQDSVRKVLGGHSLTRALSLDRGRTVRRDDESLERVSKVAENETVRKGSTTRRRNSASELKPTLSIKSIGTIKRLDTSSFATRRAATVPSTPPEIAPTPHVTPTDLATSMAALQTTLLNTLQQNQQVLIDKLTIMDVEQKRLVRRVLELEAYMRENMPSLQREEGYESENQSTVHSSSGFSFVVTNDRAAPAAEDPAKSKQPKGLRSLFHRRSFDSRAAWSGK